jgi:hypothetical protein
MSTFTPPQNATEVPGLAADTRGQARRCFQNHGGSPRGRNVFYFSDGTVSETEPDCHTTFWTATDGSPYVVQAWWGSTDQAYTLTSAQATALTNAGYTVT